MLKYRDVRNKLFCSVLLTVVVFTQDFNLPAARVYVDAGRSLARRYKYSHIEQLLRCSEETGQLTDKCHDDIILACVNIVSADQGQVRMLFFRAQLFEAFVVLSTG